WQLLERPTRCRLVNRERAPEERLLIVATRWNIPSFPRCFGAPVAERRAYPTLPTCCMPSQAISPSCTWEVSRSMGGTTTSRDEAGPEAPLGQRHISPGQSLENAASLERPPSSADEPQPRPASSPQKPPTVVYGLWFIPSRHGRGTVGERDPAGLLLRDLVVEGDHRCWVRR